jgi:hypothetical protein
MAIGVRVEKSAVNLAAAFQQRVKRRTRQFQASRLVKTQRDDTT